MNRTYVMVGILVVLLGVAAYVWTTSAGTEVDPRFAELKQAYSCPHCGGSFELTGVEATNMIESRRSIICPLCEKDINDYMSARAPSGTLGGGAADSEPEETPADEDAPPEFEGGRHVAGD